MSLTVKSPRKYHDFYECLDRNNKEVEACWWEPVYRQFFPNYENMIPVINDCEAQRKGIDRVIVLSNGKTIKIDEKIRYKDYSKFNGYVDVALEFKSSKENNKPGWMEKDLPIDFIAYVIKPRKKCYLLNWPMLRKAWKENKDRWCNKEGYKIAEAKNKNYTTLSVCVPIQELTREMIVACIADL